MPKVNGLTDKQRRFIEEYMVDCNATQAATRAGYSAKTAYSIGDENLRKPVIKAEIDRRMAERSEETGYTQERVARMLEEDRELARQNDQTSAAVQASMGLAKLYGLITDKTEHTGKGGTPLSPAINLVNVSLDGSRDNAIPLAQTNGSERKLSN